MPQLRASFARHRMPTILAAGVFSLSSTVLAAPPDFIEVEAGRGQKVNVLGVAAGGNTAWQGHAIGLEWNLKWQARLQHWQADSELGGQKSLNLVGFTPVLRATRGPERDAHFFVDVGAGVNLLSAHQIGNRQLSTNFQFGEYLGVGYVFGAQQRYELALRAQHVSNAGIEKPNQGLSYASVDLRYRF